MSKTGMTESRKPASPLVVLASPGDAEDAWRDSFVGADGRPLLTAATVLGVPGGAVEVVLSRRVADWLPTNAAAHAVVARAVTRHATRDWGGAHPHTTARAPGLGDGRLWVITDSGGTTTVLHPEEY